MKILHIIPSVAACRGGASKAAIDMVAALRLIGVDVEIACTNDNGPEELDVELNQLTEFEGVPVRFFKRFSPAGEHLLARATREFAYSKPFSDWLKAHIEEYDVLHVHALFSFTSTYAMRLARKRGIAYIAHPIGSLEQWSLQQSALRKSIYLSLIERANLRGAIRVHFTADSERDQAQLVEPKIQPVVIPLGLELPSLIANSRMLLREQYDVEDKQTIILFLGRLHPKKGIELLLRSLAQQSSPFKLLIAGSGENSYEKQLRTLVQELQLDAKVCFLGYIEGRQKALNLQGADLFALTSHSENFGIAVLEALANGTAVLVSKGVALSAQVADNNLGLVCDLSAPSLTNALDELLSDQEHLYGLGANGREYVKQQHDWESIAEQMHEMYVDVTREAK